MTIPSLSRIVARDLSFSYPGTATAALGQLSFSLNAGEFVAILGANGSGKSSLLKLLLALETATAGTLRYELDNGLGLDPANEGDRRAIRTLCAAVLQHPEDQIFGTIVGEDVARGPENLGLPKHEVHARVARALELSALTGLEERPCQFLSGGERQRLALAGALAMDSPVLLLDEANSMIDQRGRARLLGILAQLRSVGKRTILLVTHDLEEAQQADRVLVLKSGALVFDGTPAALCLRDDLADWGLAPSPALQATRDFARLFPGFAAAELSPSAVAAELARRLEPSAGITAPLSVAGMRLSVTGAPNNAHAPGLPRAAAELEFERVSHTYLRGTPHASRGLEDISFAVERGASVAIVGASGSGKTTLLRHANAVLLPHTGAVYVAGEDTLEKSTNLDTLRRRVALSVQESESAIFERFVADDVAFAPRNRGLGGKPLVQAVRTAMESVGLDYAAFRDRPTGALSGGERRKVALAGVLACESETYLLDEPGAGLDGPSRALVHSLIRTLSRQGKTVLVNTHSLDEATTFDYVAVLREGRLTAFAPPHQVLGAGWDPRWGIALPWAAEVARELALRGLPLGGHPIRVEELVAAVEALAHGASPAQEAVPRSPVTISPVGDSLKQAPQSSGRAYRSSGRRRGAGIEFFRNGNFAQYVAGSGFLYRMGGGAKALCALAVAAVLLSLQSLPVSAGVLGLVCALAWAGARLSPLYLLRPLSATVGILALMAAIQVGFTWPDDPGPFWLQLGLFSVTPRELSRLAGLLVRIAALMALSSLLLATTRIDGLPRAFARTLAPLARLGVPVGATALVLAIVLRFVPVLVEEAERITVAQISRGGSARKGRVRHALALTVPLFLRSLERAERLAVAMELRLFSHGA